MKTVTIGDLWAALSAPKTCAKQRKTACAPIRLLDQEKISEMARPGTQTLELLSALAHSPASTNNLAEICGLTQRKVWGLLKQPKEKGMVTFSPDSGVWRLNREYEDPAIDRARCLLELKGWVCIPPKAKP